MLIAQIVTIWAGEHAMRTFTIDELRYLIPELASAFTDAVQFEIRRLHLENQQLNSELRQLHLAGDSDPQTQQT